MLNVIMGNFRAVIGACKYAKTSTGTSLEQAL